MNFNESFYLFLDAIKGYSKYLFNDSQELIILLISVIILYLSYFIVLKLFLKKEKPDWRIFYLMVVVPIVLLFILFAIILYLWCFTKFFDNNHYQFTFIIIEIIFLLTALVSIIMLSKNFAFKNLYKIAGIPISNLEVSIFYSKYRKRFKKLKIWFLLPVASFLILLFCNPPSTLISIVFDNSTSMGQEFYEQKSAIINSLKYVNPKTNIVISYFPICEDCAEIQESLKNDINEIINEDDYENLVGEAYLFYENSSAISFIESDELELSNLGSPLAESIWKNYLFSSYETEGNYYKNKHLVVISDGVGKILNNPEYLNFNIFSQSKGDQQLDEFFNKIALINLTSEGNNNFFNNALDYAFYDGSNLNSYNNALLEITKNYKKDWYFVIWLSFIFILFLIPGLLINPKKLY